MKIQINLLLKLTMGHQLWLDLRGGVQAIVKKHYPSAEYVHCHAHQLNLLMMNAASANRNVRIFFASLQGICTFFSSSPQRTKILDEVVKNRLPRSV